MKILVTGSNGQVGQALVKQLKGEANICYLAVDKESLDITNKSHVKAFVAKFSPDVIINAAAYTAVDKAESEPEQADLINHIGPLNLATAANDIGAVLIHISTDYVFSGDSLNPYNESEATSPQSVYGKTKLAGEVAIQKICTKHIILRTAWVFGEFGNNFVKTMLRLANERNSLNIVDDQYGGPTYAGDIANALITIAKKVITTNSNIYGTYHYSGLPHVSWFEFANSIFKQAEQQSILSKIPDVNGIPTSDFPTPAKRPKNSRLNTSLIQKNFNLSASDWQKALFNLSLYID